MTSFLLVGLLAPTCTSSQEGHPTEMLSVVGLVEEPVVTGFQPAILILAADTGSACPSEDPDRSFAAKDGDAPPPSAAVPVEPPVIATEIREMVQAANAESDRLDALEHFLADRLAVEQGKAPRGWVQPPIEAYMAPGAPQSFLPSSG